MSMKRILTAALVSLGLAACGSYEKLDSSLLSTMPTASLKFAATSGLNADLDIMGSMYAGSLGTGAPCDQTFDGCFSLTGGVSSSYGNTLCPGDWSLGAGTLYDSTGGTCAGNAIADCAVGMGNQNLSPGPNTVSVNCSTAMYTADVTFDVNLDP